MTPTDVVGCKRIMLTDDWYPALARPDVELVTDAIETITPAGVRAGGRERAADVIVLATGFKSHEFVAPMEIAGAGGRTLAEEWADDRARLPRRHRSRLPEPVPALRAEHQRRDGLGGLDDRELDRARAGRAARARSRRGASTIEVRREAADAFNASVREALARTVWHTGCTNWYVDEHGNDPSQWPWTWLEYRRRTATLDPDAYALS